MQHKYSPSNSQREEFSKNFALIAQTFLIRSLGGGGGGEAVQPQDEFNNTK